MPDWTYRPFRGVAARLRGERRSQREALHLLAKITGHRWSRRMVPFVLGHRHLPPDLASRLGAVVPASVSDDALRALPPIGAGFVETEEHPGPGRVYTESPSIEEAAATLSAGQTIIARPAALIAAGPGWFQRVAEAAQSTRPSDGIRNLSLDPRRWPRWWWGMLSGLGLIGAAFGALFIALGPILLPYDRAYLGMGLAEIEMINRRLVPFLQHDRLTMATTMMSFGWLYVALSYWGIRCGWGWARDAFLASGVVAFGSLIYLFVHGYYEPLHILAAAVCLPPFLIAVWRRPIVPRWTILGDGSENVRRRALVGQLLMIMTGFALFVGGIAVSAVGLTTTFVSTDLEFLGTEVEHLHHANHHLIPFISHDRAGFGGGLIAAAIAITLVSLWGWRRGAAWVWWSLLAAALPGFVPTVVFHLIIGYDSFRHLGLVYLGMAFTAAALVLSWPYLVRAR